MAKIRLFSAFLLAASAQAAPAAPNPDTFVYATIRDADSLDPAWTNNGFSQNISGNVYEHLFAFKPGPESAGEMIPLLADKLPVRADGSISAEGRTYRFHIRKGVRFHDGSPLTPEDVRYSLLRFMLFDRTAGPSAALLRPILGIDSVRLDGKPRDRVGEDTARAVTVDGEDVVVRLRRPVAYFPAILAAFGAVVSKSWCAAHGQWDGKPGDWLKYSDPKIEDAIPNDLENGTGPFKLERFDRAGRQIVLARWDGYWRAPARLKRVVVKTVPELATRRLMLAAGDADAVFVPPQFVSQFRGTPGVDVIDGLMRPILAPFLAFDEDIEPKGNPNIGSGRLDGDGIPPDFFADRDVRRAFALAFDYDAYRKDLRGGEGRQAAGLIPFGMLGYLAGPPSLKHDPKGAEALLRRARGGAIWEKGFRFGISYTEGADQTLALLQILKHGVEALNPRFKIDVRPLQQSSLAAQTRAHKLTIGVDSWVADFPDTAGLLPDLLRTGGFYSTLYRFSFPRFDPLIDEAGTASDPKKRAELYGRAQDLALEELPIVPIWEGGASRVQRSWVKGFVARPNFPDYPAGSDYYDLWKE